MHDHANHEPFTCPLCGHHRPAREAVHGSAVRPAVLALIQREKPDWDPHDVLCTDCLHRFRTEYVEDVLEEEKGQLSRIEREVVESYKERSVLAEDLNEQFAETTTLGQRVADRVAEFGGSWTFIAVFFVVLVGWMALNSVALLRRPFDPFPFILLNLVLSCLAAIQAPVIMMSQNRQEAKDRLRAQNDYKVNLKAELEIRHLNEKLDLLLSEQWRRLLQIQRVQLELLEELGRQRR